VPRLIRRKILRAGAQDLSSFGVSHGEDGIMIARRTSCAVRWKDGLIGIMSGLGDSFAERN